MCSFTTWPPALLWTLLMLEMCLLLCGYHVLAYYIFNDGSDHCLGRASWSWSQQIWGIFSGSWAPCLPWHWCQCAFPNQGYSVRSPQRAHGTLPRWLSPHSWSWLDTLTITLSRRQCQDHFCHMTTSVGRDERAQIILKNQTSYRRRNNRHVDCGPLNERRRKSTRPIQLYYERPLFLDSVPCASQLQTAPRVINIVLTINGATKIF